METNDAQTIEQGMTVSMQVNLVIPSEMKIMLDYLLWDFEYGVRNVVERLSVQYKHPMNVKIVKYEEDNV